MLEGFIGGRIKPIDIGPGPDMRHDFDLVKTDSRHVVEVTRAADESRAARDASLRKRASTPLVRCDEAAQSWWVVLLPDAIVRDTLAQVEDFVAQLECMGRDHWFHGDLTYESLLTDEDEVRLQRMAIECKVEFADAFSSAHTHEVIVVGPGTAGGSSHPEVIVSTAETEALANARKLGRAIEGPKDRTHLFVWSHETRWDLSFALERAIPQRARDPDLPNSVHEVWIAVDIPRRESVGAVEPQRLIMWRWDGHRWSAQSLLSDV